MKPEDKRYARMAWWLGIVPLVLAWLAHTQWDWPLWSKILLIVVAAFFGLTRLALLWEDKEGDDA